MNVLIIVKAEVFFIVNITQPFKSQNTRKHDRNRNEKFQNHFKNLFCFVLSNHISSIILILHHKQELQEMTNWITGSLNCNSWSFCLSYEPHLETIWSHKKRKEGWNNEKKERNMKCTAECVCYNRGFRRDRYNWVLLYHIVKRGPVKVIFPVFILK